MREGRGRLGERRRVERERGGVKRGRGWCKETVTV